MKYSEFFDTIKPIVLQDELAEFLGTSEKGIIEISYLEVVKMAGHSCGTEKNIDIGHWPRSYGRIKSYFPHALAGDDKGNL